MFLKQGPHSRFFVDRSVVMSSPHPQTTFTIFPIFSTRAENKFSLQYVLFFCLFNTVQLWHISMAPLLSFSNSMEILISIPILNRIPAMVPIYGPPFRGPFLKGHNISLKIACIGQILRQSGSHFKSTYTPLYKRITPT